MNKPVLIATFHQAADLTKVTREIAGVAGVTSAKVVDQNDLTSEIAYLRARADLLEKLTEVLR